MNEIELFQTNDLVYELWIKYHDSVYCKTTQVNDITDALKLVEKLKRWPNVSHVYIREVRTISSILLTEKS